MSENKDPIDAIRGPLLDHGPTPRKRGANKPVEKRQRRTSTQAKIALAMVETHLKGVYDQMELLKQAIDTLKDNLS